MTESLLELLIIAKNLHYEAPYMILAISVDKETPIDRGRVLALLVTSNVL